MPSARRDEDRAPGGDALGPLIGAGAVDRFSADLRSLGHSGHIAVAVSGGPDSVALLLLAVAASPEPDLVSAATVDHGLRPAARSEADHVAALCERLGVPHDILTVSIGRAHGGTQAAARKARYAALADWCPSPFLLTAHHRDDVAETLLMRLARGSGVRGLARMAESAPLRDGGPRLLRPLLDWPKVDLVGICARAGIETVRDPSNDDDRYDRTAARRTLAQSPWLDARRLARAAANLAEADAALDWLAAQSWDAHVVARDATIEFAADGLPHDTRRRLVDRIVTAFAGPDPDRQVETLIAMLDAGRHAMLADVQATPGRVWTFRRAPPRRPH